MSTTKGQRRRPPGEVPHPTVAERAARGRTARTNVPRSSHAVFAPTVREDPIGLLESQAERRVPELVPIRYGRMLVSPFTYYRGAALPMAADLASTPSSGLRVQLCGDAHLSNFGVFASPERRLVFDLNDFDETLPGPWEWDVKRLGASFAVAGRENGFSGKTRQAIMLSSVAAYRDGDARVRRNEQRSTSGTRGSRSTSCLRGLAVSSRSRSQEHGEAARQGAHARQHVGPLEAVPRGRR